MRKYYLTEKELAESGLAFEGGNVFQSQAMMRILKAKGAPIEVDHKGHYYAMDAFEWHCTYDTIYKIYVFSVRRKQDAGQKGRIKIASDA